MLDQVHAAWPFLSDCTLTNLPGEFDRNLAVEQDGVMTHVLKVMRTGVDPQLIAAQVQAIGLCDSAGIQTSRVVPTIGELSSTLVSDAGEPHLVWLIEACTGQVIDTLVDYPEELVAAIAAMVPRLQAAIDGLNNHSETDSGQEGDTGDGILDRAIKWNMQRAEWVAKASNVIANGPRRTIVDAIIDQHLSKTQPALVAMPQVPIHNDLNPNNLLARSSGVGKWELSGVIDFGDMVRGARIIDFGILGAYLLARCERPTDLLCTFVAAANEVEPFTEDELGVLLPLIEMRLATSVVNAAQMKIERPDDPYVVVSEAQSWALLDRLSDVDHDVVLARLRVACGYPATNASAEVGRYLDSVRGSCAPMLPTLDMVDAPVLDLSVAHSLAPENPFGDTTTPSFGTGVPGSRGGWGEPRLIYTEPAFVEAETNGRRRTVHVGADVVGPAATPVHAPLDGVVIATAERPTPLDYGSVVILEHTTDKGVSFWTLYGHLSFPSIAVAEGQHVTAGQQLAALGSPDENGGWEPHLHLQVATTLANFGTDWPGACSPDEWEAWSQIFPNPAALLGLADTDVAYKTASTSELIAKRSTRLGKNLSVSYAEPLQAVRGWKHHIFDEYGRPHLDAYNNVPHVGHAHPRLAEVARRQLKRINTNSRYPHELRLEFADAITSRLPAELDTCFFVNSGSEANEVALRLAESWHRATHDTTGDTIVQEWGYHGITTGAINVSHYKFGRPGGAGKPDHVHVLDVPDTYRGRFLRDDPDAGPKYAAQVDELIAAAASNGRTISSVIAESFPSVGGQLIPPPGYLATVYDRVRAAGGLCIADEVQTGLGRLGHHYWGFEQQGVVPDIVVLGKPLGNGHPMAAVVTRSDIVERFNTGMEFFSTFGGSTLSCAVGLEVLQIIEDEQLQQNARDVGDHLLAQLATLANEHEGVGDVRGIGLFIGVELVTDPVSKAPDTERAAFIKNELRKDRVLIGTDGPDDNVLKIRPPLTFDIESANHLVERIDRHLLRSA